MLFKLYAPQNGKLCVWKEAVPRFVFHPLPNNRRYRDISVTQLRKAPVGPVHVQNSDVAFDPLV